MREQRNVKTAVEDNKSVVKTRLNVKAAEWFNETILLFAPLDSPPTRMARASSVFFGGQDLGRDCSFLKPLASTPGNKTLPIGADIFQRVYPFIFIVAFAKYVFYRLIVILHHESLKDRITLAQRF